MDRKSSRYQVLDYCRHPGDDRPLDTKIEIGEILIAISTAKDKRIALFGLGGSGLASALSLKAGGAELFCHDDNP